MYDLIQISNHLLLEFITSATSKELCAYVSILHVSKIDRVHGYWFCKRLLVLIETVPFTRVNVTALVPPGASIRKSAWQEHDHVINHLHKMYV